MNDDGGYTIYCSKCGAAMSSNARYCMKCGTLNYDHEANKNMIRFMPKKKKKAFQEKTRTFLPSNQTQETPIGNNNSVRMSVSSKTGNKTLCFALNFLIYLGLLVLCFFLTVQGEISLETIQASAFPRLAIPISFSFLFLYGVELIFIKCNTAWWKALIPIYNALVLGDIIFQNKWIGILSFIPFVNIIYMLVLFYQLGEAFQYNKFLTALLFPIYIPIIGFGNHLFNGYIFVNSESQKETEKDYQYRKIFFVLIMIVLLISFGLLFMNSMSSSGNEENFMDRVYFSYTSRSVVSKVSKEAANGNLDCDYGEYIKDSGVYYIPFSDVGDEVFLLLYIMREPITGYVKVDNTSGVSVYSISLSDGNLGFPETTSDQVNFSTLKKYQLNLDDTIRGKNTCKIVQ